MAEVSAQGQSSEQAGNVQTDTQGNAIQHGGVAQVELRTNEPGDTGRPAWLPEGFDTAEQFREAYDKLQAGGEEEDTLAAGEGTDTLEGGAAKVIDEEALKASLKEAGGIYADPRYEPLAIEFEKTGALSPESVTKAAADFGVPENAVKDFIAGQKALRENATLSATAAEQAQAATLLSNAGITKEIYQGDFNTWATENLPAASLDAYNKMTDMSAATLVLKGWVDQFKASTRTPRDITTGASGSTAQGSAETKAAVPFASMAEQLAAQGSREYASDPTARRLIEERIRISNYR